MGENTRETEKNGAVRPGSTGRRTSNSLQQHDRWLPTVVYARLGGPAAVEGAVQMDIFQAVGFFRMENCPTQAVLPLVGLAADKIIRDRYGCPRTTTKNR